MPCSTLYGKRNVSWLSIPLFCPKQASTLPAYISSGMALIKGQRKAWKQACCRSLMWGTTWLITSKPSRHNQVAAVEAAADDEHKGIMDQYATMITTHTAMLQQYSTVVVADGYFMKQGFIDALTTEGFQVVTKGRRDASLKYLYHGKQRGIGHPRWYSGKVNLNSIDKRRWK